MKLTTAGESHGKALLGDRRRAARHLKIDKAKINGALALRQSGFGRGARQKIEKDEAEILSGVRGGETLGSPLALCIRNRTTKAGRRICRTGSAIFLPAPSPAFVRGTPTSPGCSNTGSRTRGTSWSAPPQERRRSASAAGEIFRQYLSALGVEIAGYVREVCGVKGRGQVCV